MGTLRRKPGREVWMAIYRDGDGIKREVTTGCKSKDAAKQVLSDLERDTERVVSGVVTRQEARTASWADVPLSEHFEAYLKWLETSGVKSDNGVRGATPRVVEDRRTLLKKVSDALGWKSLRDIKCEELEGWLAGRVSAGMGNRTRNRYAGAMRAFCRWLVNRGKRLAVNPLTGLEMLDEELNVRHERRALSVEEFAKLVDAAERRPVVKRGSKKPEIVDEMTWLGRTHGMVYRTLFYTGLRLGELRSITLSQVHLDAQPPHIELKARDEKARRGALLPVPSQLAWHWPNHRRTAQAACGASWRV